MPPKPLKENPRMYKSKYTVNFTNQQPQHRRLCAIEGGYILKALSAKGS